MRLGLINGGRFLLMQKEAWLSQALAQERGRGRPPVPEAWRGSWLPAGWDLSSARAAWAASHISLPDRYVGRTQRSLHVLS